MTPARNEKGDGLRSARPVDEAAPATQPADRLDLDGLTFDAEWAANLDRDFFADSPDRAWRVRSYLPGEFGPEVAYAPTDPDAELLVIVARGAGLLVKQVVTCRGRWPQDEDAELASLFATRQGPLH